MNVGLIGKGYWGTILLSKLEKICDVKFVCNSKDNYKTKLDLVDWVFVATPNDTHFNIVKYCLQLKKNVFCEKPLTLSYKKSKKLLNLAKKYGVKLYVSDVFNYRKERKNITDITKPIKVIWNKVSNNTLYDLMYHDLYLLWPYWVHSDNIEFSYGETNDKTHKINDVNFTNTKNSNDALLDMIKEVLYGEPDYEYNKTISLMCNKVIDNNKKTMKITNLWNKLRILSGNILEVKVRLGKIILLDLFLSTSRIKLMILNIGFESK
jgi:hypothetical protein